MSSQVSDLYKKYNDMIDELKKLKEDHDSIIEKIDKVKLENKDLQSEIILLVKQVASLEKIVHTYHMNAKNAPKAYEKNYDDVASTNTSPGKVAGTTDSRSVNPLLRSRSKDPSSQYYIINPRTKQIIKNPNYTPSTSSDDKPKDDEDAPF